MRIEVNGWAAEAEPAAGESLLGLLARQGFRLNAPCGGNGRCGKCRVLVENAAEPGEDDKRLLDAGELAAGVRLACRTVPFDGIRVRFEEAGERPAHIATEGNSVSYKYDPMVSVREIELPAPSLADQSADVARLARALGLEELTTPRGVLRELPQALRSGGWKASAVLKGNVLLGLNPSGLYGLAVDIGTTTLACYLVDLITGAELAVASALNPQKAYGDDVISRCDHARSGSLDALQKAVAGEIDALVGKMCAQAGVSRRDIFQATFAGNTVMMHLFAGIPPENIALSPFIPAFTDAQELGARELGLGLNPEAAAALLPCVAGYIGADTVAGIVAAGMRESSEPSMLIDIGTNGEIALAVNGRMYACSTAAGPAFEGAHIRNGMGGVAGAINKVEIDDGLRFTTIGNAPVRGICGSGLLDLVAGLLDCGAIDDTGRLDAESAPKWLEFEGDGVVVDRAADIVLTGRDIREVQLAKGAVAAGIDVIADEAGIKISDIRHVYLAGGFGSYMDRRSACRVGLIPKELEDRTVAIGNSSGAGAKAALLSKEAMEEACMVAKAVKYIELSARKDFQEAFMEKMLF
jgi:uncharacterized 2Fe-2S/4Fe-4S cluster protein (DUF4445 family)